MDTMPSSVNRAYRATAVMQWPITTVHLDRNEEQAIFETRIHPQTSNILGFQFSFGPYPFKDMVSADTQQSFTTEPAALKTKVTATSLFEAANRIKDPLFYLVDDLAFQLQTPLRIQRLDIIDITPPVAVAELRDACTFHGFDPYRKVRSSGMSEFEVAKMPVLRNLAAPFDSRIKDALDWYMKGMDATNDPDRFIFFWIAFEILVKLSNIRVEEPTKLRCQHLIENCPTCGKSTSQYRQWATDKRSCSTSALQRNRQINFGRFVRWCTVLAALGQAKLLNFMRACIPSATRYSAHLKRSKVGHPSLHHGLPGKECRSTELCRRQRLFQFGTGNSATRKVPNHQNRDCLMLVADCGVARKTVARATNAPHLARMRFEPQSDRHDGKSRGIQAGSLVNFSVRGSTDGPGSPAAGTAL